MAQKKSPQRIASISTKELVFVGCFFLLALQLFRREAPMVEFSPDEGFNLMKALLLDQGYSLYSEVWSDQPPFFSTLLRLWMDIWGWDIEAARRLVGITTAVLLVSLYTLVRQSSNVWTASLVCGLLLVSNFFFRASGTAIIGLPAISLSFLALALVHGRTISSLRTALSGGVFACALATKLFVLIYFPVFLVHQVGRDRKCWRAITVWFSSLGLVSAFILLAHPGLLTNFREQLVVTHSTASQIIKRVSGLNYLRFDLSITLVGLLSSAAFLRHLKLPCFLLLLGLMPLAFHEPSWWHHYFLVSVPLCWVTGAGIELAFQTLTREFRNRKASLTRSFSVVIILLFGYILLSLPMRTRKLVEKIGDSDFEIQRSVLEKMRMLEEHTTWIGTDRPVYAFALRKAVPPELAVTSEKRFVSGSLSDERFFVFVELYKPEQVVLCRFDSLKELAPSRLGKDYELVEESDETHLYQRRDVLSSVR